MRKMSVKHLIEDKQQDWLPSLCPPCCFIVYQILERLDYPSSICLCSTGLLGGGLECTRQPKGQGMENILDGMPVHHRHTDAQAHTIGNLERPIHLACLCSPTQNWDLNPPTTERQGISAHNVSKPPEMHYFQLHLTLLEYTIAQGHFK